MKTIDNKKAFFDYEIIERFEAGIALEGSEVKSIRAGNASLEIPFALSREKSYSLKTVAFQSMTKALFFNRIL